MAKFATSARAVDMLGRQQIAGVPTALSELFKNSYDAYARTCRVDYLSQRSVLLLRDDGVGMSEEDFLRRWLTLATDSKAKDGTGSRPFRPPGELPRPTMGEKGIGRLAIASLGPLLLVVTQPHQREHDVAPAPVTTALLAWTLFETPGLTLDEVEVPVRTVASLDDVNAKLLRWLITRVERNLDRLNPPETPDRWRVPPRLATKLREELDRMPADPVPFVNLPGPRPDGVRGGTIFLVSPVSDDVPAALTPTEREQNEGSTTPLQRLLVGFTDTMLPGRPPPAMRAQFFVHEPERPALNILDPKNFWMPEDFRKADHDIVGTFDEKGTFTGQVQVYQGEPMEAIIPWSSSKGGRPRCGPFSIRIGYIQGNSAESRLGPQEYAEMSHRLNAMAGLYVYRDGIRVQPYGSADVDYLNIEERRSRRASSYYFSYRRMFGAIEISSSENSDLVDKASREGFRENAAFRDFKSILESFLIEIARDFFTSRGEESSEWEQQREELKRTSQTRRRLEETRRRRASEYHAHILRSLESLEEGEARREVGSILSGFSRSIKATTDLDELVALERDARSELSQILVDLTVEEPVNIALNAEQRRDSSAYAHLMQDLRGRDIAQALEALTTAVDGQLDQMEQQGVEFARTSILDEALATGEARLAEEARLVHIDLQSLTASVAARAAACIETASTLRTSTITAFRGAIHEDERTAVLNEYADGIAPLLADLRSLRSELEALASEDPGLHRRLLEEQVIELQEQADANSELLLLGQAVQVIDHELESSVGAMRRSLQALRPRARRDSGLQTIVTDLYTSFEHLDSYLRLFTPMQRRLYRSRTTLTGDAIADFLNRVFEERLQRHGVELVFSRAFRDSAAQGYPSTFLPVFVNLVDNAIYWCTQEHRESGGVIHVDAADGKWTIADNGAGVPVRAKHALFDRGYSRKPGGRGLGLAISREALHRHNPPWEVRLAYPQPSEGAVFELLPMNAV